MEYNINTRASVQLTDKGKEILFKYADKLFGNPTYCKHIGYNEETNTLTTELWHIMQIFGKFLYNGCEIPFVNNKILIKNND